MKQPVRDFYGKVIGFIEDTAKGKTIRDFYGKIIGFYDKQNDVTRDFYGKIVAKGDQSSMLFYYNK